MASKGLLQEIEPFDGAVDVREAVVVVALEEVEDTAGYEEGLELRRTHVCRCIG